MEEPFVSEDILEAMDNEDNMWIYVSLVDLTRWAVQHLACNLERYKEGISDQSANNTKPRN